MSIRVGVRASITMKFGQGSIHRESDITKVAVCGIALQRLRFSDVTDYWRHCPRCFKGMTRDEIMEMLMRDFDSQP